ncbi:MAG: type II secretion system F family protein [Phycisphaerae bacterium]|nr:type II secretion system F family protein [Phycisphaerae bacterium]
MPTFEYIALDRQGKQVRGSIAAESASAARKLMRTRQLHTKKLRSVSEASHSGSFELGQLFSSKRRRMVLEFTKQLATMIKADVKLTESLGVMIAQSTDPKFTQILQNIRDQLLSGENLADGLREYPGWFDTIYVSMVRVGEATGNLGRSLNLLSEYIGKRQKLETKVKSALTYPAVLVVICLLATVFLMTVVVPKLAKIIISSGKELPAVTQIMMNTSNFLISWWWLVLIALAFGSWMLRQFIRSNKGRTLFDRLILRIPVIGELMRQSIVARFSSTLAALIRSGMPIADSLKIVADVTGNTIMNKAVREARDRIIGGADIATPLRESKVVGPAVAHMISVGERSGELESMLVTVAKDIEEATDETVQRISSVIEPVIIVVMAVVVGLIIYSIVLPIMQVSDIGGI